MDGNFSKYATTSAGDIVGVSVAALIGRASIPSACTIRYGFCHSRASATERYFAGSAGGIRFFSVDVPLSERAWKLGGWEQETKASVAPNRQAAIRSMHRILAGNGVACVEWLSSAREVEASA